MLYIHIPFCKQACHYCDFHFSTSLANKDKMVIAICKELELQKSYLSENKLDSIYFGGGTPSLLSEEDLEKIFQTIRANFQIAENCEITLEANPDDLSKDKFRVFKKAGINRLSIGIQTFNEAHLQFMNRAHNAHEAIIAVKNAQNAGFENLSIDLIYGIPSNNHSILENDLEIIKSLNINHISAYCLTIEPKTTFGNWVKTNKMNEIDEDFAKEQFDITLGTLIEMGFEQYEISNFAKNKAYSKHNTNYWFGKQYLGIGPSAHSYNGESRQYNIANNNLYIKGIEENNLKFEKEFLSPENKTNEYILTKLRTTWGLDLDKIEEISGKRFLFENKESLNQYLQLGYLELENRTIKLSYEGKLIADKLASDLFLE
jgi:oxygen-independent coproporphyrinogen III oxidase